MNNVYNTILLPFNTPTVINGVTVPARSGYSFKGLIAWCEVDCVIEIKKNLDTIGGGRISGAVQTLFLDYSQSPFGLQDRDIISVIATQNDSLTPVGSYQIFSTLLVEQL